MSKSVADITHILIVTSFVRRAELRCQDLLRQTGRPRGGEGEDNKLRGGNVSYSSGATSGAPQTQFSGRNDGVK